MESVLSERSLVVAVKEQAFCSLAEEAVILDLKAGVYYSLNEVGARIWYLIQEPKRVSDIRETILQEFDVERDRCDRDVRQLLQNLAGKGLIEVQDEKAA